MVIVTLYPLCCFSPAPGCLFQRWGIKARQMSAISWQHIFDRQCTHPPRGSPSSAVPTNTRHSLKVGSMLAHRLRRWANIEPTLGESLVFAGSWWQQAILIILNENSQQSSVFWSVVRVLMFIWPVVRVTGQMWSVYVLRQAGSDTLRLLYVPD